MEAVSRSTFGGLSCLRDCYVIWTAVVKGVWSLVFSEIHEMPTYLSTFLLCHFP